MAADGGIKNTSSTPIFSQGLSFFDPSNQDNRGSLIANQQNPSAPTIAALDTASGLHLPDKAPLHRTDHFPEELYDLSPTSHLMRFLQALLGDAGTGQLRKRYAVAQFQQALTSTHFYDLDSFYGAIFNADRTLAEDISAAQFNPYTDPATAEEWDDYQAADASYRERINALAKAVTLGATRPGLLAAAEAVLGMECDLYEGFELIDPLGDHTLYTVTDPGGDGEGVTGTTTARTWGEVTGDFVTWGGFSGNSWLEVEFTDAGTSITDREWHDIMDVPMTWSDTGGFTWAQLEVLTGSVPVLDSGGEDEFITQDGHFAYMTRYSFQIRPKKPYNTLYPDPLDAASARAEDEDAIRKVINVIKPAGSLAIIDTDGVELHLPISLGALAADSEYWEIVSETVPRQTLNVHTERLYPLSKGQTSTISPYTGQLATPNDPHEAPHYAFGQKQGDDWSYASEVVSAVSYAEDENEVQIAANTREFVSYADGSTIEYSADHGLLDAVQALAGKYASSGVTVAAPYSDTRVQVGTSGG